VERLRALGHEVIDFGANSDAACDYPEYAGAVAHAVRNDQGAVGMLFCATGHGMAMAAGKVRGIRAFSPTGVEAARLSRFDNNSNVLCLGGRNQPESEAFEIAETWLSTGFAGGRHARRIAKVAALETASAVGFVTESESLRLAALKVPACIWERNPAAFTSDRSAHERIRNRMGWLNGPADGEAALPEIVAFADEIRRAGFRRAVVLGMGGSSLCAEVLGKIFGPAPGWLNVYVLDCNDPVAVTTVEGSVDLERTLFVVASKSGGTVDVQAFERYFWAKMIECCGGDVARAGQHFVAITETDSPLAERARSRQYRRVFACPADVGGRFSALTVFGLVPAALMGMDVGRLLARARSMASACRENTLTKNPGVMLGTLMGALAKHGRDKLTLLLAPDIAPLGPWIEQLVAESTGKSGRGIVPIDGEPTAVADRYQPDRVFVVMRLRGAAPIGIEQVEAITVAGHPIFEIELADKYDVGAEFFRWEFATAVAGVLLQINPFDEPNVIETKETTRRLLETEASVPAEAQALAPSDPLVATQLAATMAGEYLAICPFFHINLERERLLHQIRLACRDRLRVATTLGHGPRFLHSTGQLHKGGPFNGVFLQLLVSAPAGADLPIPGEPFTFAQLRDAQALGDWMVLREHGKTVVRVDLGTEPESGLRTLLATLTAAS
jgi:RpiB/LacA/LacB family sugar-phosphate isomerase